MKLKKFLNVMKPTRTYKVSCVIEVEVKKDVKLMVDMKFSVEDKRKDGEDYEVN